MGKRIYISIGLSDCLRDCLNFLCIEYEYSYYFEKKKRRKSEACIYDALVIIILCVGALHARSVGPIGS